MQLLQGQAEAWVLFYTGSPADMWPYSLWSLLYLNPSMSWLAGIYPSLASQALIAPKDLEAPRVGPCSLFSDCVLWWPLLHWYIFFLDWSHPPGLLVSFCLNLLWSMVRPWYQVSEFPKPLIKQLILSFHGGVTTSSPILNKFTKKKKRKRIKRKFLVTRKAK